MPSKPPDEKSNEAKQDKGDALRTIAKYSGLGFEMVAGILAPVLLGQYLDNRKGNTEIPVFTLAFGAIGVFYVFYRIFKISSN